MIGLAPIPRRRALITLGLGVGGAITATILPSVAVVAKSDMAKSDMAKSDIAKPDDGEAIYTASFKNLKDTNESLDSLRGKVVVMYFWATWCVPCRVETPKLVKLHDAYKARGVAVVGIALDNGDKVRAFVKEMNATYPVFYGGHDAVELGRTLGNVEGAIPFMVVVDKAGRIAATFKGDLPDGKLEAVIDPLIG